MDSGKKKIGAILIEMGIITEKTLQRALEKGKKKNKRVGYVLEDMGVITSDELAEALARQFGYKKIEDIVKYQYPADVLGMIPVDVAVKHLIFPMKIDNKKLFLAVADPTDTKIMTNLAENHQVAIVPFVASRPDIMRAINKHYLGKDTQAETRKTVLIAEDSPAISAELSEILSREGYNVIAAKDGIEAFKLAVSSLPSVIITDKEMPIFGGYRLLQSILNLPETRQIPVILLTASLTDEEEADTYNKGFFDYMTKPVKNVTLITKVKRELSEYMKN